MRSYVSGIGGIEAHRDGVQAGRRESRRHVGVGVEELAVAVRVEPRPDAAQVQPFGDGHHHGEAHGGLAKAAEDDLLGGSLEKLELDRAGDLVHIGSWSSTRFSPKTPSAHSRRQNSQEHEQRLVRLR